MATDSSVRVETPVLGEMKAAFVAEGWGNRTLIRRVRGEGIGAESDPTAEGVDTRMEEARAGLVVDMDVDG